MNTEINLKKVNNNFKLNMNNADMKTPIFYKKGKTKVEHAHIHSCYEIYVNLSGDVSFLVESNLYPLTKGDIIITMPNEMHHCVYNSDSIHDCFCLWFDSNDLCPDIKSLLSDRTRGQNNLICMSQTDKEILIEKFQTLYENADKENMNSSQFLACLYSIFDLMYRYKDTKSDYKIPRLLGDILSYIDSHISSKLGADDVATHFYISRSTLYRLFDVHLGITPARYIEDKRFSLAKSMMTNSSSLKEVCTACGFTDYSHFISVFKRKFGTTPYKFMKSIPHK